MTIVEIKGTRVASGRAPTPAGEMLLEEFVKPLGMTQAELAERIRVPHVRETELVKELGAVFIYGIGWTLKDGYPHELRAADYDDWVTETLSADGRPMHGLNGDILLLQRRSDRLQVLRSGVNLHIIALHLDILGTGVDSI